MKQIKKKSLCCVFINHSALFVHPLLEKSSQIHPTMCFHREQQYLYVGYVDTVCE